MLGYTNAEFMQKKMHDILTPQAKMHRDESIKKSIEEYRETNVIKPINSELKLRRKDGVEIWTESSWQIAVDENGEPASIIGVTRDIDKRKRMEIELAEYREHLEELVQERTTALIAANEDLKETIRAKEKAEEADRRKSTFLANMSHEIRTPLNGIVGLLQIIEANGLTPEQRQELVNIMNTSSSHLVNLIDDIIDISKIEAQQLTMHPAPVHLNALMNELRIFFETYLKSINKGHVMMILNESGLIDRCVAYVDPKRLRQVLNNLIGNAIKFTEEGHIRFGYRQSAPDQLEFVVEDTGIGLPADQQDIIFERFRQSDIGNDRKYGGTGLGLPISRSLAEMMGGSMWVQSTEDEGSAFYFTIPYVPVVAEDAAILKTQK
jgi:PAS domain S-box-containing protein